MCSGWEKTWETGERGGEEGENYLGRERIINYHKPNPLIQEAKKPKQNKRLEVSALKHFFKKLKGGKPISIAHCQPASALKGKLGTLVYL